MEFHSPLENLMKKVEKVREYSVVLPMSLLAHRLESVPDFKKLKKGFFDFQTVNFFRQHNFFLHLGSVDSEFKFPEGMVVFQKESDDVRAVYRSYNGFMGDDFSKQSPYFKKIGELAEQNLDSRFPEWRELGELVVNDDSVVLKPNVGLGLCLKGHGLELALSSLEVSEDLPVYVCVGNGEDSDFVEWCANKFKDHGFIAPNTLDSELGGFLVAQGYNHKVLPVGCGEFVKGFVNLLKVTS
jgi:hypothetical protein